MIDMELKEVINKRKSIREFSDKKISKTILKQLIKDAGKAPSACNIQPWYFYIVNSKENVNKIKDGVSKFYWKNRGKQINKIPKNLLTVSDNFNTNLGNCQAIILATIDKKYFDLEDNRFRDNIIISVGAAIENLILSATDKGIGSC